MRLATVFLALLASGLAQPAAAAVTLYTGPHPIDTHVHKGMCYIEGPHVHSYRPQTPRLYIDVHGRHAFVGDPVEFEPEAPKHAYYGHHPLFWLRTEEPLPDEVPEGPVTHLYCYITGPHYHWYAPPPKLKFELRGGVNWYVGPHPEWYKKRYRRHRYLDRHYAHVRIPRPEVSLEVEPPEGFVGVIVGPRGPGWRVRGVVHGDVALVPRPVHVQLVADVAALRVAPAVHLHGPGVQVRPPGVDINIRLPGVGVVFGGGHRHGYKGKHKYKYKYKHKYKHKHRGRGHGWGHRGKGRGKWK